MARIVEGKTTIIVSHRLASLVHCSTILVLDRGHMVGNGPHRRLLDDCETYRTLWEKQSRSFR
jgi:ATP-binding cassette subfamily B protein